MKLLSQPVYDANGGYRDVCIVCERAQCPSQVRYSGPKNQAETFCRQTSGWLNVGPKLVCSQYCAATMQGLPFE